MEGLDDSLEEDNIKFYFFNDIEAQAIVKVEEDSLEIKNIGLGDLGSNLKVESIGQISSKVDLESKRGTLECNDIYQIRYYTEPYNDNHNLEINII